MVDRQTKMVSPSSSTAYLPLEIICIIIKQTDDVQTLENWCSATRRCRALRTFTLKTRWANVIISQDNLISKFDDLPSPTWGNDLIQRAITNENATEPLASLIKSLTLWFQFRAPPKVPTPTIFSYDRTCDNWDPKWLPSSEDIQHSLSTLLPHCTSLKQLDHDGVLYQENLDEICKLTTIECVRLRTTYPNFPARWRHPPYHCGPMRNGLDGARMGVHFEFRTLPFENLGRLQNLVQLEIGEIWEDEGRGIAQAVGQLRNLKVLSLTAGHKTASDGIWPSSPTQLRLLFVFLFSVTSEGEEGICKLPATLESLVISDPQSS